MSFIVSTLPCELESESRNCPLKNSFILWLHETSAEAVQHLPRRASHSYSSNVLLRFLNVQDTQHYVAKHKTEWTIIVSLSYSDKVWIQSNWSITKTNWRMSQSQVNHNKFISRSVQCRSVPNFINTVSNLCSISDFAKGRSLTIHSKAFKKYSDSFLSTS